MRAVLLFVEDDPDDVELTTHAFRRYGFEHEIEVARDGAQAYERLREAREGGRPLPSAVLMDLKMPKMSGLEVLRRMREDPVLARIPVILLTSSGHERDKEEALRLGAKLYLQKPADPRKYAVIAEKVAGLMRGAAASAGRRSG